MSTMRAPGAQLTLSLVVFIALMGFFDESRGSPLYGEDSYGSFPYFEYNVPRNVTTVVGQPAFLHCRVEQLGDKAVSWIRKRDLHILTAGILTYTSDQRFQVIRPDKSENWTLQIKFPQERDAGIYECQVNTEPKMSLAFQLNVVAKAKILGPVDLYVKAGSRLSLTCVMSQGPHDLGTVYWYKDSTLLEYKDIDQTEEEIAEKQRLRQKTEWTEQLTSHLTIEKVVPGDSGNYSCVPTLAESASVIVHVISGEHPAAMQHGNVNSASFCTVSINLVFSLYCTIATLYTSILDAYR
ncbi:zwei Ig domain protein zig-8-like isoform X2 [Aricia agestis]|uniref:zwei Ig domain protein zig-8-like isoform X2 n=1 Tax=Aricia agestis TaxID=91739 RepID=UPI001C204129|nr:zwei Ig domain protein zig-8-like isoform X2 [Aricia agestis]